MWSTGYSAEKNLFYGCCMTDEITASYLYSYVCNANGPVSMTQCLNNTVSWVDGDYNFVIWGPDKTIVNQLINECSEIMLRRRE